MKYDITCTIILCAEPDIHVQIYYIRLTKYFFYLNRFRTSEAQTTYTKKTLLRTFTRTMLVHCMYFEISEYENFFLIEYYQVLSKNVIQYYRYLLLIK